MESTLQQFQGLHLAIIMDGNGRWAELRGRPRIQGHLEGSETVRTVVSEAPALGVGVLTLYAFSAQNWGRPRPEVESLMRLLERYLNDERKHCRENGVRVNVVGRRDRLNQGLLVAIRQAERYTCSCRRLHLRLAVDYSSQYTLTRAARLFSRRTSGGQRRFARCLQQAMHSNPPAPEVDLLIRTSGEKRLSDFLLWETAYAELYFTDTLWPDFSASDLREAVEDFHSRRRRFGLVTPAKSQEKVG